LHYVKRRITTAGTFRFGDKLLHLANALVNHDIGLEETDDGVWAIYFNTVLIATRILCQQIAQGAGIVSAIGVPEFPLFPHQERIDRSGSRHSRRRRASLRKGACDWQQHGTAENDEARLHRWP